MTAEDGAMASVAPRIGDPARLAAVRASGLLERAGQESLDLLATAATLALDVPVVGSRPGRRRDDRTHISAKHQVTIPIDAFVDAGFEPGDIVRAEALGPGRVVLTRQDDLLDEFSGSLHTDDAL